MKRLLWLDGLRGLAAAYVLSYHFFWELNESNRFLLTGWLAVDLFFVLSGFVLAEKMHSAYRQRWLGLIRFTKIRIIRLYPAILIALLFTLVLQFCEFCLEQFRGMPGQHPAFQANWPIYYLLCLFLVQFLFPISSQVLFLLWSLSVEFWGSLCQLSLRLGSFKFRVTTGILVGVILIFASGIQVDNHSTNWFMYSKWLFGFGRFFLGFNIGILMYGLSKVETLFLSQKITGIFVSFLFVIIFGKFVNENCLIIVSDLCFGLLVLFLSKTKSPSKSQFLGRSLKFFGETSYGLYLFQEPILNATSFSDRSLFNFFINYVFILLTAMLSFRLFEPWIRVRISKVISVPR
jgi:peptidoglycan/LPS O-acetylase OafA/YrhL